MSSTLHDNTDELFHFDTALDDTAEPMPMQDHDMQNESRDPDQAEPLNASGPLDGKQKADNLPTSEQASGNLPNQGGPPQAMLLFMMGEHRFSDSVELGVLNEHPEALNAITPTQFLTSSAFLKPALQAAMAELRPSLMESMAVQLTSITFRLVSELLSMNSPRPIMIYSAEYQELAELVGSELDHALPYFGWQRQTNHWGRAQYLMALLEEALRTLGIKTESLVPALKAHTSAKLAVQDVAHAIANLRCSSADVCGEWAATLLSAWPSNTARSNGQHKDSVLSRHAYTPDGRSELGKDHSRQSPAPDAESDTDELPPLSKLVSREPGKRSSGTSSRIGDTEDDPMCISDSDLDNNHSAPQKRAKKSDVDATRSSCRSEALKVVDYNTKRHPQDKDIPSSSKKRKARWSS